MSYINVTVNSTDIPSLTGKELEYLQFLNLSGRKAYWKQGYYGERTIVAVIDTGVNKNHPELKGKVLDGLSFVNYTKDTFDDHGHGTHVAGSIAGANVGIAPKANILPIKVLDGSGDNVKGFDAIIDGFEAVGTWKSKDNKRVNIVSASLSGNNKMLTKAQIKRFEDVINWLTRDKGISVIVSAGNTYKEEKRYPSSFYEPICVGALDMERKKALFSTTGDHVDLSQIGVDVLSAWHKGGYKIMSGTSMSTPIVSGIAALIADKYEALFGEQIHDQLLYWLLKMNTRDVDVKGVDKNTGAGFCSLQPVSMNLFTHNGDKYMTNNDKRIDLDAPITVIPPGRTTVLARPFIDEVGGAVYWNPETQFANFQL